MTATINLAVEPHNAGLTCYNFGNSYFVFLLVLPAGRLDELGEHQGGERRVSLHLRK